MHVTIVDVHGYVYMHVTEHMHVMSVSRYISLCPYVCMADSQPGFVLGAVL